MNDEMFNELLDSVQQMDEIVKESKKASRTFDFPDPEVKAIRERLGVSQEKFATILGVSKRTLENWSRGVGTLQELPDHFYGLSKRIRNMP